MTENIFPYELPKNWHWTTLENVAKWGAGGTPSRKIPEYYRGTISWIKTGELNDGYIFQSEEHITAEAVKNSSAKIFPKNSVVIAMYGATIGKVGILGIESSMNQACACAVCEKNIYFKFLFHYLISQKENFVGKAKGGAQPNISQEIIKKFLIPLPPIGEQKKIVERIESLFSKLDSAKSIVQKILDGYELRRTAILHKAFTGELSKNFRAENNLSLDDWENLPLSCVFSIKSGATLPIAEEKSTGKIPYVKVSDMNIKENSVQIITSSKFVDNCRQANIIPEGSVIFPKRGGAIFTNKKRYVGVEKIVADLNIMALIPNCNKIFSWYGYYWMLSVDLKEICNGSNIPQINHKDMMKLFLSLPPLAEQKEIVRVLDSLLDKERRTKEIAEKILQEIDLLKKSVLARAFRGD